MEIRDFDLGRRGHLSALASIVSQFQKEKMEYFFWSLASVQRSYLEVSLRMLRLCLRSTASEQSLWQRSLQCDFDFSVLSRA